MLGLLENIVEIFENIPGYILYAIETFVNGFFSLIQAAIELAQLILPELPEVYTPPKYLAEVNWYYPVGTLIGIATPLFTAYIAWLGISYLYRKFGAIS
jgi:hypothetical protein